MGLLYQTICISRYKCLRGCISLQIFRSLWVCAHAVLRGWEGRSRGEEEKEEGKENEKLSDLCLKHKCES